MTVSASLPRIAAFARAGALDHAWKLFRDGGYEAVASAEALTLRGRLLKDSGRAAGGADQRRFYGEAADAYAQAATAPGGGSYQLINAATLSLLAGRRTDAQDRARMVLARGAADAETEYWSAATRAEALLLTGDTAAARSALAEAIAKVPRAFEDHASTLRQFRLILDELGEDAAWLDAYRPPRVLHFAGHLGLSPDGGGIASEIRRVLDAERVGFGFGALAAGADIVIAEALLERGAELVVVLPVPAPIFREASVARIGDAWIDRFDAILAHTPRVHVAGGEQLSPLAIRLATEVAMGSAAMQARALNSEAIQMLVADSAVPGAEALAWVRSGRRRHRLVAPRTRTADTVPPARGVLAAMLRIGLPLPDRLDALAAALAGEAAPQTGPRWTGDAVFVSYDTPAKAIVAVRAVSAIVGDGGIAGHYGIAQVRTDPFGGPAFLEGATASLLPEIARSTPPGAVYLSEDFAATLSIDAAGAFPIEFVGELDDAVENPTRLYALLR